MAASVVENTLPHFVIIGSQRCGTSSLYSYLIQHPNISPARRKEVHYFDLHYDKGLEWYCQHFPTSAGGSLTGEASPYYLFHPLAAERCARDMPNARLIVMLRNPVDRAYSHYHHEQRKQRERLSFEEAIGSEEARLEGEREKLVREPNYRSQAYASYSYQARGIYVNQLESWMARFPAERILVLESERFFEQTAIEYRGVLKFLRLPPLDLGHYRVRNAGSYSPMARETRRRLVERFEPHNQSLCDLLGQRFDWDR